jgi:hypothetical protein
LRHPFRKVAEFAKGKALSVSLPVSSWLDLPLRKIPSAAVARH